MVRVSPESFRAIMIALAVVAVSYQLLGQRQETPRHLSAPQVSAQGRRVMITDNLTLPEPSEAFSRNPVEHSKLKKKVERLEAELKEKSHQLLIREQNKTKAKDEEQVSPTQSRPVDQEDTDLLLQTPVPEKPKSCSAIVQRMHDWNDCWRRHLMTTNGRPWEEKITCSVPVEKDGKTTMISETIGAPLYGYAYYAGQGFGVLIQHTTDVCLLAFLLKRPCVINNHPRDPFNNWGSFIAQNTYQWDPSVLHEMPEYANQLEALLQQLPKLPLGSWKEAIQEEDYTAEKSHVFPMNKFFDKDWDKVIDYYSGTNSQHGNQVLVSPNWGDAWMGLPMSEIFQEQYDCDREDLLSSVQNAMYGPTHLTWQLHQERYERADATVWNPEEKAELYKKRKQIADDPIHPAVRTGPHLSSTTQTVEGIPAYGAIHMRTYMINRRQPGKIPLPNERLADVLTSCLVRAQELIGPSNFPTNWWFIADNAPIAVDITQEFYNRQNNVTKAANSSLPKLRIFNDYQEVANEQLEKSGGGKVDKLPSLHSLSKDAIGLFGHANMAGSIQDWMALHESKISIVTGDTSYGTSGSRGHGKKVVAYCGGGKADDKKKQLFKILLEKKEDSESK